MTVIDWLHLIIAVLFLVSALIRLRARQAEHFFTRFVNAVWFTITVFETDMPVAFVRTFSLSFVSIMMIVEITSPFLRWDIKRRKK